MIGAFKLNGIGKFTVTAAAEVIRYKKSIIANGNAQIDTAQSKFGGSSALFDGTSDYITSSSHSDFAFGTGDFTIEVWARFTNFTSGPVLLDQRTSGSAEVRPTLYVDTTGKPIFFTNGAARITGNTLSTGTWYHIALSRSSTSTKLFVDGTQVGTTYTDSNNYLQSYLCFGAYPVDPSFGGLNGWMDEIRISNTARYTANFTPSTTPFVNDANTVLLLHMDGTDASTYFEDDNGVRSQKGIVALGNAQVDTAQSKFGGSSALFDGTGDYLTIGNTVDADMALTGTTWTVEYWARINAHAGSYQATIAIWDDVGGTGSVYYFSTNMYASSNKMGIQYVYGTNSNSGPIQFGSTLATGVWKHHAYVRNGNTLTAYLDGVSQGTQDMTGQTIDITGESNSTNTPLKMTIGAMTGGGGAFNGWLDEIRISNIARYTAGFTPSTTPFVNDANTVLLIHADGTDATTVFRDDNGSRTQIGLIANNGAAISTTQSKFGGTSMYFDGTDDTVTSGVYSNLALNTGSWTIEGWIYTSDVLSEFMNYQDYNTNNGWAIGTRSSNRFLIVSGDGSTGLSVLLSSNNAFTNNTWTHFAFVYNGSTMTIYANGTSVGSSSWVSPDLASVNGLRFGTGYGNSGGLFVDGPYTFQGYLDEIRISNIARYTANFTAPTTPFQNDANTVLLIHADGTNGSTVFVDDNGKTPT